jgi:threonine dehydrogenase-like Zn-dependent dehydrogenase
MAHAAGAVGIVGLGLIGGSLARALRARDPHRRVLGVEPDSDARALAERDGLFDLLLASPTRALGDCEVVVLCAPVASIEELLEPVSRQMDDGAVLTDVGGIKEKIAAAEALVDFHSFPLRLKSSHCTIPAMRGSLGRSVSKARRKKACFSTVSLYQSQEIFSGVQ